ncbi:iron-containing alcohol dehydrogenase PsrA [Leisingera thetidis]|uniref:iron-containing alcohol dehydrogenase PsrA n=1 Tax=Leisingera thetidis TaxID=2930199 RepID=UPI0021F754A5|nr:iron-containing alcohol dehydrogenase PsrA [Leisingera thetidis]
MWNYSNPVKITFGDGGFNKLPELIGRRAYALITYPEAPFTDLAEKLVQAAGPAALIIDDIAPNPDYVLLADQSARFAQAGHPVEVIVALGGGSVIDSAKVFAAANGDFGKVAHFLETKTGAEALSAIPIIAVPTTAGTGSEVTCWATVWDEARGQKFSLARPELYPETAIIDPALMLGKPYNLTLATGLDALSHALESIWNVNANPVSARHAVVAAKIILDTLPKLVGDLGNLDYRARLAEASLSAGLAFSNTKTAIAHNLSYPITLRWGVQHGIACSFSLPTILRSMKGIGGFRETSLQEIFGADLESGAAWLTRFLNAMGVGCTFKDQRIPDDQVAGIIDQAFAGERGRNFIGTKAGFLASAEQQNRLAFEVT